MWMQSPNKYERECAWGGRCKRVDQQAQAPVQPDEVDEVYKQAHSLDKLDDMNEVD